MAYPGQHDGRDADEDAILEGEDFEDAWADEEQLSLADSDEPLPWLENDDIDEEPGFDWRLVTYAVLGLGVVALLLGAIWWFTRDAPDAELQPVGSTIAAPEGAYRQRPENPGGTEVEGTGDQAFQVAEGQSTRGVIAEDAPRPAIDREQAGSDETAPTPAASTPTGAAYVQIGAFSSRADADTAWASATGRYPALSGLSHRVVEGEVNGATVYRLQAISGSRSAAEATCRAVRGAGGECYIR